MQLTSSWPLFAAATTAVTLTRHKLPSLLSGLDLASVVDWPQPATNSIRRIVEAAIALSQAQCSFFLIGNLPSWISRASIIQVAPVHHLFEFSAKGLWLSQNEGLVRKVASYRGLRTERAHQLIHDFVYTCRNLGLAVRIEDVNHRQDFPPWIPLIHSARVSKAQVDIELIALN